jgi:hypothetical protein
MMIFNSPRCERTIVVDVVRKLDIPISARVSVFCHVIYPVLNSTTMSFICKWAAVDNLSLIIITYLMSLKRLSLPLSCNVFLA